jgi:hypothetical protein
MGRGGLGGSRVDANLEREVPGSAACAAISRLCSSRLCALLAILVLVLLCWARRDRPTMERIAQARAHRTAAAAATSPHQVTSAEGQWVATLELSSADVQRVQIHDAQQQPLHFADVMRLWETDSAFVDFHRSLLAGSPFEHFFWECPPVSASNAAARPYEHVTVRVRGRGCNAARRVRAHAQVVCSVSSAGAPLCARVVSSVR